jgi:hypothetical protein
MNIFCYYYNIPGPGLDILMSHRTLFTDSEVMLANRIFQENGISTKPQVSLALVSPHDVCLILSYSTFDHL